jgi:5'-3' exonuclease
MGFLRPNENTVKAQNEYFERTTASLLQREQKKIYKKNAKNGQRKKQKQTRSQCEKKQTIKTNEKPKLKDEQNSIKAKIRRIKTRYLTTKKANHSPIYMICAKSKNS